MNIVTSGDQDASNDGFHERQQATRDRGVGRPQLALHGRDVAAQDAGVGLVDLAQQLRKRARCGWRLLLLVVGEGERQEVGADALGLVRR